MRAFYNQRMECNPHLTFIRCNWVLVFSLKLNIKNLTPGLIQISIKSLQLFLYAVEVRNRILAIYPIKTHPTNSHWMDYLTGIISNVAISGTNFKLKKVFTIHLKFKFNGGPCIFICQTWQPNSSYLSHKSIETQDIYGVIWVWKFP